MLLPMEADLELDFEHYTVAWIAPLEIEAQAAWYMLDNKHKGNFTTSRGDDYLYMAGDINGHNIVIATFPAGHDYGVGAAAALASQVKKSFPNLWFGLLVGVAAGLPNLSITPPRDIRLGDILVGLGEGESAGLLSYGLGKETSEGFKPLHHGLQPKTETIVRSAIGKIKALTPMYGNVFLQYYESIRDKRHSKGTFEDPGQHRDQLHQMVEENSSVTKLVERPLRSPSERTKVWYGTIGTGDTLMKNAQKRDELRDKFNLIGLEMEAAGIMSTIRVGVIRGVYNCGDAQKNKEWQPYAAAMAAAYAKALLYNITPDRNLRAEAIQLRALATQKGLGSSNALTNSMLLRGTNTSTAEILAQQRQYDVKSCLESLSFPEVNSREKSISAAHPATFHWIQQNQELSAWLRFGQRIFWIQGKPGSGKSTMIKYMSELWKSKQTMLKEPSIIVAMFFNGRGAPLERTIEGFLRTCLIQMLQQMPSLFSHFQDIYLSKVKNNQSWDLADLKKILVSSVGACKSAQGLCLFVDALDECGGPIREHLEFFQEMIVASCFKLQICISGRPLPVLVANLGRCPNLILQLHTANDISAFVGAKLGRLFSASEGQIFLELQREIIIKADGIFLWVVLVVEELLQGWEEADTVAELRKRLSAIPSDLSDFFKRIMWKINKDYYLEAVTIFNVVLCAMRPLTLAEFRYAMAFGSVHEFASQSDMQNSEEIVQNDHEMEKRIRSRSGGLVELETSRRTIQFIHQTVIDFLLAGINFATRPDPGEISCAKGHQFLLRACIQYLSISDLKRFNFNHDLYYSSNDWFHLYPLLEYSTYSWVGHYKKAEEYGESQSSQIAEFASPTNDHFLTWCKIYSCVSGSFEVTGRVEDIPFLFFPVEHNLGGYVKEKLQDKSIANVHGGDYAWPLQTAVVGGHLEMVRLLLDCGADINARGGKYGTAMAAAITLQRTDIITLLLNRCADVLLETPRSPLNVRQRSALSQQHFQWKSKAFSRPRT